VSDSEAFAPPTQPGQSTQSGGQSLEPAAESPAVPESTGLPAVDEVTASLAVLDGVPVDSHVAVFESAHERLRAVLASGGAPTAPTA
jgi:hypothetical protein